ncbi:MAG TPA: arginine--tRNA ligase [Vicinamibacterales bacterium]|nr:arginine--tRNA ligase [Vicinamibacterales bacterium]
MILPVYALVRSRMQSGLERAFGLAPADQPAIVLEVPPRRALGDLAAPVAFELARRLRKAPKVLAQELQAALGQIDGVSRIEAAPNGYVNFFLDRPAFVRAHLTQTAADASSGSSDKVIVEHTAINPNKAAHIGHLRNAALGDTLVRLLRFQGHLVEVQNYIDDTGVQVADVVVGFTELEGRTLDQVQALADDPATRFDYYCWDLYAKVTEWYEGDKARLDKRAHALHAIEEGNNAQAEMGAFIADRIVRHHLRTMARMNVDYDLLTWEGDILRLHFWATAFDDLKARNAVFLQTEGRLKGCWVMPIEDGAPADPDAAADDDAEQREKVIVRSNGTVTYVGKDIANQFWKFGLLGRDFYYRVFERRDGHPLWATTSDPGQAQGVPKFGRASAVYNVIDSRQSYLQLLLKQALSTMGFKAQADRSTHFSYDMVALSHATARALGYDAAEGEGKAFVEVSGRKGLGVKADDLLDRLIDTAGREVGTRNPELAADDRRRVAEAIAVAAVRYFLIKFSRGKVIAFDIDEALSFEGETGPYLQYAAVRAGNILAKLEEREGVTEDAVAARLAALPADALTAGDEGDELWGLVLEAARLDEIADNSVRSLELAVLAKYAFGLAQAFNAFYHRQPILKEEREDVRLWRAAAVSYVRRQLTLALDLMGCKVPVRM